MHRTIILTIVITALSFIGFIGYGLMLIRKSDLELKMHKMPKRNGVSSRFKNRFYQDIGDFISVLKGNKSMDYVSNSVEESNRD